MNVKVPQVNETPSLTKRKRSVHLAAQKAEGVSRGTIADILSPNGTKGGGSRNSMEQQGLSHKSEWCRESTGNGETTSPEITDTPSPFFPASNSFSFPLSTALPADFSALHYLIGLPSPFLFRSFLPALFLREVKGHSPCSTINTRWCNPEHTRKTEKAGWCYFALVWAYGNNDTNKTKENLW